MVGMLVGEWLITYRMDTKGRFACGSHKTSKIQGAHCSFRGVAKFDDDMGWHWPYGLFQLSKSIPLLLQVNPSAFSTHSVLECQFHSTSILFSLLLFLLHSPTSTLALALILWKWYAFLLTATPCPCNQTQLHEIQLKYLGYVIIHN